MGVNGVVGMRWSFYNEICPIVFSNFYFEDGGVYFFYGVYISFGKYSTSGQHLSSILTGVSIVSMAEQ